MKFTTIIIGLLAFASLGAAQDAKPPDAPEAGGLTVATVSVPTIQCGMCVKSITKAVTAVEGVTAAEVDLDQKTATVKFDATKTDQKKLERVIAEIGYDANDTKRDPEAYEKLSPCCKMDE